MKRNLAEISQELNRQSGWKNLPGMIFLTDQIAQPLPEDVIENLPRGAMVIFRDYEHENRVELSFALRNICRLKGIKFLVAGDLTLAIKVDADGIHLPEHMINEVKKIRKSYPKLFITASCHSKTDMGELDGQGLDAILLAPIFETRSHPETMKNKGLTIGPGRLRSICEGIRVPIYALGGVNNITAEKLKCTGVAGIAAIRGF